MRRILEKYAKERLERIVRNSRNEHEVLAKMKHAQNGSNYQTLRKYINVYGIDTSHFETKSEGIKRNNNGVFSRRKPLSEILVDNIVLKPAWIKIRLIKEGLKKDKCEECGQGNVWRGKKITLILDHRNGNRYDFRFENLRIACPNCAATFDTHCRGMRRKRIKEDKRKKQVMTKLRIKCRVESRKVERPDYFSLKNEINKFGYSATGRKYNVSDNAVRKWLKNYERNGF